MSGFLDELGKKAAEQWLGLVVLPGLLWTAVLLSTTRLRHDTPTSIRPAIDAITDWTIRIHTTTDLIIVLLGLLLASIAAGLTTTGLAVLVRRAWLIPGRHVPSRWLTTWRRHRWTQRDRLAHHIAEQALTTSDSATANDLTQPPTVDAGPGLAEALARRDAISLEPPQRPTWIGDHWHATYTRIHRTHGLDLTIAWPRLWAVLPDNLRTDITGAHTTYNNTSTLTAWAMLYLIPTILWWPTALIALTTLTISQIRARTATTTLCQLIETAADLHTHTLIRALHPPDPHNGFALTTQLRKQPPHRK